MALLRRNGCDSGWLGFGWSGHALSLVFFPPFVAVDYSAVLQVLLQEEVPTVSPFEPPPFHHPNYHRFTVDKFLNPQRNNPLAQILGGIASGAGDDALWWGMERAGDMPIVQRTAREPVPSQKFLDAVVAIRQDPAEAADHAFLARQLIQCTLPHTNPGNVPVWSRRNGNLTLSIKPGSDRNGKPFGIPYGVMPRMLLYWLNSQAVKARTRRLELGNNLSDFMRAVGFDPNTGGGVRGDAPRLRNQMERLFRAMISFEINIDDPHQHGHSWLDMQVAPSGQLWWDPKRPEEDTLWGNWIMLGEDFYTAITASPVPVDVRALRALKRSPLALDLYSLAVYKAHMANRRGAQFIPWRGLLHQLGANYDAERIDHFKDKVKRTLRNKVAETFPGRLKYDDRHRNGLTFLPGTKLAVTPALEA